MRINRFQFHAIDALKVFTEIGPIVVRFADEEARRRAEIFIRHVPIFERLPGVIGRNYFDVVVITENSRMDRRRIKDWKQRPGRGFKTAKAPSKATEFKMREVRVLNEEATKVRQSGADESAQNKQVGRVSKRLTNAHRL